RNLMTLRQLQHEVGAELPRTSLWFTAMRENFAELPQLVDIAVATGIPEVYVQRLIYFGEGLARKEQALYHKTRQADEVVLAEAAQRCAEHGIAFRATGATTPEEYLAAPEPATSRPWSACHRPHSLAYISALGNVYSCCFAPFHPGPAKERILGNVF